MIKNDSNTNLQELKNIAKKFVEDRNWNQFHTPKELAINMSVESSELLEHFVWKSNEEITQKLKTDKKYKQEIVDELGDVIHSCLCMANVLDINLTKAIIDKIEKTAKKYPVEKVKGKNKKYTEY